MTTIEGYDDTLMEQFVAVERKLAPYSDEEEGKAT